jgi:hypothetical protein
VRERTGRWLRVIDEDKSPLCGSSGSRLVVRVAVVAVVEAASGARAGEIDHLAGPHGGEQLG